MPLVDIPYEAAVLRGALLVGLVHESYVAAWATMRLAGDSPHSAGLSEVTYARNELTAQREALRPLAAQSDDDVVAAALQCWAFREARTGDRDVAGMLRIVSDLRREGFLTRPQTDRIKELEDRAMLASVGMQGVVAPTNEDIAVALDVELRTPLYLLTFTDPAERDAFASVIVRREAREERPDGPIALLWQLDAADDGGVLLVLSETAYEFADEASLPLPTAADIPYVQTPFKLAFLLGSGNSET